MKNLHTGELIWEILNNLSFECDSDKKDKLIHFFSNYAEVIYDDKSIIGFLKKYKFSNEVQKLISQILDFSQRVVDGSQRKHKTIISPMDVFDLSYSLRFENTEVLNGFYLNIKNQIVLSKNICVGAYNKLICTPGDVLTPALQENARNIILVHNHPSGDNSPSEEDLIFTRKIIKASKILGVFLLDHIIITQDSYFSFKKANLI